MTDLQLGYFIDASIVGDSADDDGSLVVTTWLLHHARLETNRAAFTHHSRQLKCQLQPLLVIIMHTYIHPLNSPLSGTTQVGWYQKDKTNLDFTGARDSEWQWHQLGHMQVCTLLQADNHASTPPLVFYRPDALPAAQPTASKH